MADQKLATVRTMKKIEVTCSGCRVQFQKALSEVKISRNHYCTKRCQAVYANNNKKGNLANLLVGSSKDEFSQFRYFLRLVRVRHKRYRFASSDLTLPFLKELWEQQNGICPLTGWKLILPLDTERRVEGGIAMRSASLDRIRPREPYNIGNVRFVAFVANLAKHTYKDDEVVEFCRAVVSNTDR